MAGFNGTRQIIDVPANNAAQPLVPIVATGPVRRIEVIESVLTAEGGANVPQGLHYQIPNDGSANGFGAVFATVPPTAAAADAKPAMIVLGDRVNAHGADGSVLGNGQDQLGAGAGTRAATVLLMVGSATGQATSVEVTQYY